MNKVGPYEIRTSLGQGGGGEVFRAWDPRLERDVALKILHQRFEADPERVLSFVAEARAASALNHPNIVTVFDAAVDGGTSYIVSELIDGRPLRDELGRGPMPIKRLLDLATQIADGLSAAHDAGIRHGDLKPENIMITRTGRAKILDFGLTRSAGFQTTGAESEAGDLDTRTVAGLIAGTVPYMSPEQARGLPSTVHSDQFAFGLILYEMASGRRAFSRETSAATLDAIINDEAAPIPGAQSRAPLQLRWIIERCLAKDPGDRYGATSDLHRDLRTLRDRLAEATPVSAGAESPSRKVRRLALLVTSAVLVFLAGTILTNWLRGPAPPDLSTLRFMPLLTEPGFQGVPAWSPNGETIAYAAEVDGYLQIFARKESSAQSTRLTFDPTDHLHPFWSPDGRLYFVSQAGQQPGIFSIAATGGEPQIVVENATRGAISRDGTLAFLRDETDAHVIGTAALWLSRPSAPGPWNSEAVEASARKKEGFEGRKFIEGTLSFSPDGKKLGLWVVPGPGTEAIFEFWVVPVPEGQEDLEGQEYRRLESWSLPAARVSNFTWADNRHVLLGVTSLRTPGPHLWMADLDRNRVWPLTIGPGSESYPSASASGDSIVFGTGEPEYDLLEIPLDTGDVRPLLTTARNESEGTYSRNGDMAFVTDRRGQDEIWVRTRDGRIEPRITQSDFAGEDQTLMLSSPAYSPDGKDIAYLRNGLMPRRPLKIGITLAVGGQQQPLLPRAHEGIQGAPTWSPKGEWIAYAEWIDEKWQLVKWRVTTGETKVLKRGGVASAAPHWSKDDWITWETEEGFVLVSADGATTRTIDDPWEDEPWLVHTWSADGSEILGVKESFERRLKLVSVPLDPTKHKPRVIRDLGPLPPVNSPVKGLSISPDGKTVITSIARLQGDLWIMNGLDWRRPAAWWPWSR